MLPLLLIALWIAWLICQRMHQRRHFYQYLFFFRFPILAGLALTLLPVAAVTRLEAFIGNWFNAIGLVESAITIFLVLLSARTLCYLVQLVVLVMPVRADLPYWRPGAEAATSLPQESSPRRSKFRSCLRSRHHRNVFIAVAIPALTWSVIILRSSDQTMAVALGLSLGIAAFVALRWLSHVEKGLQLLDAVGGGVGRVVEKSQSVTHAAFQRWTRSPRKDHAAASNVAILERNRARIFGLAFLGLYVACAVVGNPEVRWPERIPLPVYPILILTLVAMALTGLSSFVDSKRVPASWLAALWPFVLYGTCDVDHEYRLRQKAADVAHVEGLDEREFAARWMESEHRQGANVPIVVTTSGGGISAAVWTAAVLDALRQDPESGDLFARSILATSSVSGGSAGIAHWLQDYGADGPITREESRVAVARAGANSLSAVAWGLAVPDTLRLFLPVFAPNHHDRGWALETSWERHGLRDDATLLRWRDEAQRGLRPVSIFNATVMETGQRLQIATHDPKLGTRDDAASALSWLKLYPGWDLRIGTAARLSASFPYVAPVARPAWVSEHPAPAGLSDCARYHVADGGYFDNDGVASALEFLDAALPELKASGARGLILLRIRNSPVGPRAGAAQDVGWKSAVLGPVQTMLAVRTASQVDRNRAQLDAMLNVWRGATLGRRGYEFPILDVVLELHEQTTLSWLLSADQHAAILKDLEHDDNQRGLAEIRAFLQGEFSAVPLRMAR